MITEISEDPKNTLEKGKIKSAIVVFYTTWCGDCVRSLKYEKALSEEFKGKISFYRMDAEKYELIASKYKVENYPTYVFFKNGNLYGELLVEPSSEEEVREWITKNNK